MTYVNIEDRTSARRVIDSGCLEPPSCCRERGVPVTAGSKWIPGFWPSTGGRGATSPEHCPTCMLDSGVWIYPALAHYSLRSRLLSFSLSRGVHVF